jgi:hypothetical protein
MLCEDWRCDVCGWVAHLDEVLRVALVLDVAVACDSEGYMITLLHQQSAACKLNSPLGRVLLLAHSQLLG